MEINKEYNHNGKLPNTPRNRGVFTPRDNR